MAQAKTILDRFKNTLLNINYRLEEDTETKADPKLTEAIANTKVEFEKAMDDDFNVQNALAAIYDLLPIINANAALDNVDKDALSNFKEEFIKWLSIFGIDCEKLIKKEAGADDDKIDALVKERDEARKNKDWARSDEIRDQLKDLGVTIQDTPQGTRWTRE